MSRRKKNLPAEQRAAPAVSPAPPRGAMTTLRMAAALGLVTFLLFLSAKGFDFVNYDDPMFVTNNKHLPLGFTWENIAWAFRNSDAYLWHPLTWLTYLLDYQLYGLKAGGYHLTNVLLHSGSTMLLFLALHRMTGALWRSAAVAALFAWHPLHVQSVAWIAERKDVLSCFFWMLTLWCYCWYVERRGILRYLLVALAFALGLMSKPMVVTLPCVLLLLDVWPLKRLQFPAQVADGTRAPFPWRDAGRLVVEKIPLFAMVAAVSFITVKVMNTAGVLTTTDRLSIGQRVVHSVVSYVKYVRDIFAPVNLSVFYPMNANYPLWQSLGAAVVVLAITVLAVREIRRNGFVAAGWFWFLGTMVPTIGLVQNGGQAMADRYTYIPYVGAFIALVWGLAALAAGSRAREQALRWGGAAALGVLALLTLKELEHWRNSITLFSHATKSTTGNYVAHYNLAVALDAAGRADESVQQYRLAIKAAPDQVEAAQNMGVVLYGMNKVDEAIATYEEILRKRPNYAQAHVGLGAALDGRGEFAKAMEHFYAALKAKPDHVAAYLGLGMSLAAQGKPAEAVKYYVEALKFNPGLPDAELGLAGALLDAGNAAEAIPHYQAAISRMPPSDGALTGYGIALARVGKLEEAESALRVAVQVNASASTMNNLANVLVARGKAAEAIDLYGKAMEANPNWLVPINSLARLLSMGSDATHRNGPRAVQLAQKLCQATNFQQPLFLETLSAAYAETGQFDEAVATAQKALAIFQTTGSAESVVIMQDRIRLYQNKQPYHVNP